MEKWKILKRTNVSPSKWFPVEQHTVEIHDHKIIEDYYISTFGDGAMVLAFNKENHIVLIKQYKHGLGDITYDLPAGFLQQNKTIKQTAVAELQEETGIKVDPKYLIPIGIFSNVPAKIQHNTHSFLVQDVVFNTSQNLDPLEEIEIEIKTPQEVLKMIADGIIIKSDVVATITTAFIKFPKLFS